MNYAGIHPKKTNEYALKKKIETDSWNGEKLDEN